MVDPLDLGFRSVEQKEEGVEETGILSSVPLDRCSVGYFVR